MTRSTPLKCATFGALALLLSAFPAFGQAGDSQRAAPRADSDQIRECVQRVKGLIPGAKSRTLSTRLLDACSATKGDEKAAAKRVRQLIKRSKTATIKGDDADSESLGERLRPCRAEAWRLSRAKSLYPTVEKARVNSKILEACVNVEFSAERALNKVASTYFSLDARTARRRMARSASKGVQTKGRPAARPSPKKSAECLESVLARFKSRGVKAKLSASEMTARVKRACRQAQGDPIRAFKSAKEGLK